MLTAAFFFVFAASMTSLPPAPAVRLTDTVVSVGTTSAPDPLRWMEDGESTETKDYVRQQNLRTDAYFAQGSEQRAFAQRLKALWNYERVSLPHREGEYYYVTKNSGLQPQSPLYRQKGIEGNPELLLDPNTWSEKGTAALAGWRPSPSNRYLIYIRSDAGSDWQEARVYDMVERRELPDQLRWLKFSSIAFAPDESGFWYCRFPQQFGTTTASLTSANKFHRIYFHRLGAPQSEDRLVYDRPDNGSIYLGFGLTDDNTYLVITESQGTDRNDGIVILPAHAQATSSSAQRLIELGTTETHTFGSDGDNFYLLTRHNAPRGRIVIGRPGQSPDAWREIVPQSPHILRDAALVQSQIVVDYMQDAQSNMRRFDLTGKPLGKIDIPAGGSVGAFGGRRQFPEIYITYSSPVVPPLIYSFNTTTNKLDTWFEPKLPFEATDLQTTQVFAVSRDGTRVPVFVVYKKGLLKDGSNPTRLGAYGGFGANRRPDFSVGNIPWLEAGGVVATAIIRGGGEYGREWHEGGRLYHKSNCFEDFEAAARYLCAEGWTSSSKLSIEGASNGGLLVAACINRQPTLFRAAVADVPVTDMARFHKFTVGWGWIPEYGNPDVEADLKYLLSYSPYHNVHRGQRYPATLIRTADHDDRVVPMHSYKLAALLQAAQPKDAAPVLLSVQVDTGHGAGKSTEQLIDYLAQRLAFLARELKLQPPSINP